MAKWSAGFSSNNSQITELENLEIYGTFSILSCIVSGTSTVLVAYGSFKASQKLHDNLLFSLLRSPMTFFDTTPLGRILNRLSKDIEKVDNDVPMQLSYSATLLGECAFYLISAIYFIPQIGFLSIFVMIIFVFITIRRLCSAASSAVASHLQDSYVGVNTIRVFSVQDRFSNQMMKREVTAIEADLGELVCNKWIELRMSFLTSIFTSILTAFAIYFGHIGYITAAAVALVTSTGTMLRNLLGSIAKAGTRIC
uniref:ABC transmembrane type-1 domain-containing protein n=1 Tax=Panagrolaimus superbus TaxID=310955 RepID=A0A914YXI9_9BILA